LEKGIEELNKASEKGIKELREAREEEYKELKTRMHLQRVKIWNLMRTYLWELYNSSQLSDPEYR
jgi:hypothetical protein